MSEAQSRAPQREEWDQEGASDSATGHKKEPILDETQGAGNSRNVVLVIVAVSLVFISVMTYFVSQMPPKP